MTGTARLPQAEITGLSGWLVKSMAKRMMGGDIPEGVGVMWHSPKVVKDTSMFGRKANKWPNVPSDLKALSHMVAASTIGCTWCLDFGYYQSQHEGLDLAKAREVPRWRASTVFTPLERRVMAYAEAMCQLPLAVTDDMVDELQADLGPAGVLELTAWIACANMTARMGVALGLEAAGMSAHCGLPPLAEREEREVERA
ncbi:carboxymuconolactone decarboxylase family protein [Thermocrispum municipale]|jgi:alkylhydroperoxidase family enzyme|uniref:carboxymuconolactone decarboxylase family protein n=1 Tax=Thermocrispum municipale TaxID=37926 RepID=UPI00040DD658|nr:carboxymuconolactone decarboxylase family protein [Thermocrispum municipale]